MEQIKDITDLLGGMSRRERKAAKKYFSRYYSSTKELQLFNILEGYCVHKKGKLSTKIKKLGYESLSCNSFLKLKVRLKNKIIEYYTTNTSIEETKHNDLNAHIRQKMRKLNLQAQILSEKSHISQAQELIQFSLRLGELHHIHYEMLEAFNQLDKIYLMNTQIQLKRKISGRLTYYRNLCLVLSLFEEEIFNMRDNLKMESLNDNINALQSCRKKAEEKSKEFDHPLLELVADYTLLLEHTINGNTYESTLVCTKWMGRFRNDTGEFELGHKLLFLMAYLENLKKMERWTAIRKIITSEFVSSLNNHNKIQFDLFWFELSVLTSHGDKNIFEQVQNLQGTLFRTEDELHFKYLKSFSSFKNEDFKLTSRLINDQIGFFSSASLQKLDLMVLELMTLFEQGQFDLLEYKIQSFAKNIAYRSKYKVPPYYYLIYRCISALIRKDRKVSKLKLDDFMAELDEINLNRKCYLHALQLELFVKWIHVKATVSADLKSDLILESGLK